MSRDRAVPPAGQLRRLRDITQVLVTYGFQDVAARLRLAPRPRKGPFKPDRPAAKAATARRLRQALEDLGPTFIKFGQALSTRADLLPPDFLDEFSKLQDHVPPMPAGVAEATIAAELGSPVTGLFAEFESEPIAAASIAQVHRARLPSGERVAIKVRRPGIAATIEGDLAILAQLGRLAERYLADADLLQPVRLVREFARAIRREQDLAREGRTIDRFRQHFDGDATVFVPRVFWERTTSAVLTMEFVDGVKVSDLGVPRHGFDRAVVARRGANAILRQVLKHGLFHADPHPANIFVLPGDVICFLDFGTVGRLDRRLRDRLASLVQAIVREDVDRMTDAVLTIAEPVGDIGVQELRQDVAEVFDAYSSVRLNDMAVGALLLEGVTMMGRHRLRFPPDLLLLAKAFVTIEGVGRQLDPSFTLVEHARPLVEEVLRERLSPSAMASRLGEAGRDAAETLQAIPREIREILGKARRDRFQIQFVHRNLDYFVQEMDRSSNRLSFAIVIAALIVGSSLIFQSGAGPALFGYPALGLTGFLTAALLGIWLVIGIVRSGRL
ncbi:MAG: AarF/UbiB family protein [Acidobacteriota bacterium]